MVYLLRWSWLIFFFGLFGPLDLPAGGGSRSQINCLQIENSNKLFAGKKCYLKSSPLANAKVLRFLPIGTPLRAIRSWNNQEKIDWIQVEVISFSPIQSILESHRGWINVSNT